MRNLVSSFVLATLFAAPIAAMNDAEHQKLGLTVLGDMVSHRSAVGHNQVVPLARMLEQLMLDNGFSESEVNLIETEPEVAALVVRLRGDGSGGRPVLMMGHIDVVDALTDQWTTDPFKLTTLDNYLYGRGVVDHKGGSTALLTAFIDRKSTRLNSSHSQQSRMPSSA